MNTRPSLRKIALSLPCPQCRALPNEACRELMSGADIVLGAHEGRRKIALLKREQLADESSERNVPA
jgi:hypothetical protein